MGIPEKPGNKERQETEENPNPPSNNNRGYPCEKKPPENKNKPFFDDRKLRFSFDVQYNLFWSGPKISLGNAAAKKPPERIVYT